MSPILFLIALIQSPVNSVFACTKMVLRLGGKAYFVGDPEDALAYAAIFASRGEVLIETSIESEVFIASGTRVDAYNFADTVCQRTEALVPKGGWLFVIPKTV